MAGEETIARATIQLGVDGAKLSPEMAAAVARAQAILNGANKKMEREQATTARAIQRTIDKINAVRPTKEMQRLEQAVAKLGGTSKLTSDQIKRVAMDVNALAAAGAKVPASLSSLTGIGSKLSAAFSSLTTGGGISGALAAIGPAGIAAAGGLTALSGVTYGLVAAFKDLGERGTLVTGVRQSFEALAGDHAALLEASRKATRGMVSDFDLMQTANKGLLLGLPITASEMEVLGNTAVTLGKAMNVGPTQALQDLITGLGRGSAAILDNLGITVKAEDAQKRYAESLGKSASDLTEAEKKLAIYYAALESAKTATDAIGTAQATMGDSLQEVRAAWDNLKDSLAESIAQDPAVVEGLEDIADAVKFVARTIQENRDTIESMMDILFPSRIGQRMRRQFETQFGEAGAAPGLRESRVGSIFGPQEFPIPKPPTSAEEERDRQREERRVAAEKEKEKALEKQEAQQEKIRELLDKQVESARALAFEILRAAEAKVPAIATTFGGVGFLPQARNLGMGAMVGAQNFDFGIDAQGFITWGAAAKDAGASADEAGKKTATWSDTLGSLADQLNTLADTTGGLTGKIVGFAASLATGLGGVIQGFQTMKGAGGGFMGFLGKLTGGLGIVGSAVGIVGGIVGGIKKLFGGKSKEEKAAEAAAKKQAAEEARQAKIQAAEEKKQGLLSAKGFAESLMDRLAAGGLSEALTAALSTIVGKVGDALLKSGLGILDQRLRESKEFQEAQGLAADVAGALAGMRQAGMIDEGLLAAGGAAAGEIRNQAINAALAAGLSPEEAARAGSAAIAPLLREQLNASLQSGRELDANTKALLEEAKKNGIEILADPAIESLNVQKEQLDVLRDIAGQGSGDVGAARGFGPMITPDLGGGRGPRIKTHAGEYATVIPRSRIGPRGIISAAAGIATNLMRADEEDGAGGGGGGGGFGGGGGGGGGGTGGDTGVGTGEGGIPIATPVAVREAIRQAVRAAPVVNFQNIQQIVMSPWQDAESKREAIRQMMEAAAIEIESGTGRFATALDRKIRERRT